MSRKAEKTVLDEAADALAKATAAVQQAKNELLPTHISVVLDRSGSMSSIRADTIGGFNAFLRDQKALPDMAAISLHQFDHEYDTVYSFTPIKDAPELTEATFVPRGSTALLDAIGRTIQGANTTLPTRRVIVIITDGQENASREFTADQIKKLIKEKEALGWQFIYLGANQDAFSVATSFGIPFSNTMSVAGNMRGTASMYASVSKTMSDYRTGAKLSTTFEPEDLKAQEDAGAVKRNP